MKPPVPNSHLARFGVFELDLRARELRKNANSAGLPEQSIKILALLVENPGEVVLREEIRKRLWPNDTVVEFDHSINAAMKRLRHALGDSAENPHYIETLARRGYRWMVPVEWVEATPAHPGSLAVAPPEASTSAANLIGKKVSHYRVLEVLGGGGMGVVYKAEDLKLGRRVALKFLPEELANDPSAFQRFEHEARAASALNHPNICTIYAVEEHDGQPFIAMELLEGQTLRELISAVGQPSSQTCSQERSLQLETLLSVAIQIAEGLEAAHKKGIIHRDIKPANIFVTTQGPIKILDFGLAKLQVADTFDLLMPAPGQQPRTQERNSNLTLTGTAIGTAGYMSPEQVRGEKLDTRTDLFSFGLVLYELAVGQRAFAGETAPILRAAILEQTPISVRELNPQVPSQLEEIIERALEKDRELRYQSASAVLADLKRLREQSGAVSSQRSVVHKAPPPKRWFLPALGLLLFVITAWIAFLYYRQVRRASRLDKQDTVVLGEFANSTGDDIFNDTLRRVLNLALWQSPFLDVLSSGRVDATLRSMSRSPNTPLTPEIVSEVCRRLGSKAYILGSIRGEGATYVLGLKAVNCQSGTVLAEEQITAESKEKVLDALGDAAAKLRGQLGESPADVWKYDVPLKQGTTGSLEALKEYSLGVETSDETQRLHHLLRAIQLDPSFALAYSEVSTEYLNLNQPEKAIEYISRAYELQDHALAPQRLQIVSTYYFTVTGELSKVAETYQNQIAIYPRKSLSAYTNLGLVFAEQGQYEKAAEMAREAIPSSPDSEALYSNLSIYVLALQRFSEARETTQAALARNPDSETAHQQLYALAFLARDSKAMSDQLAWLRGRPEFENAGLSLESDTDAYAGHLSKARDLTREAVDSALRIDNKEAAAIWWDNAAMRDATVGNAKLARQAVADALRLAPTDQSVDAEAALALAIMGDTAGAESLAQALAKRFPMDTMVQSLWLPTIDAQLALMRENPTAAIERLQAAAPMELAYLAYNNSSCLYPVDVRGEAYLALGNGAAAATEFQKIVDHSGIVQTCLTGALAHLGLARANALEAQAHHGVEADAARAKALAVYRDFFALWKDADPDIPILKQAKAEYAKLQ